MPRLRCRRMTEQIDTDMLKLLLSEVVYDILKDVELIGMTFSESRQDKIARIQRYIEKANLNGE